MSGSTTSAGPSRRWNIAETHTVERRKTAMGYKLVNDYRLLQTLGQGRFGKVKLCERLVDGKQTSSSGGVGEIAAPGQTPTSPGSLPPPAFAPRKPRHFAMKILSKPMLRKMKDYCTEPARSDEQQEGSGDSSVGTRMRVVTALDRVRDEIQIMRSLYHRNIVLLFEVIDAEESDKIYLVLEYMAKGPCMLYHPEIKAFSSQATGGALSEELARSYLRDIFLGLEYLHQRRICHRDIKPDNILLNESGRCHISDFGCAKAFSSDVASTPGDADVSPPLQPPAEPALVSDTVGTYQFLAPECCSGEPYDPFKVDVWAVGVVLYIFLFGKLPFTSESTRELFEEITRAEITLPEDRALDFRPEHRDLLLRLLEKDPEQRMTIAEALHHPWLAEESGDDQPLSF